MQQRSSGQQQQPWEALPGSPTLGHPALRRRFQAASGGARARDAVSAFIAGALLATVAAGFLGAAHRWPALGSECPELSAEPAQAQAQGGLVQQAQQGGGGSQSGLAQQLAQWRERQVAGRGGAQAQRAQRAQRPARAAQSQAELQAMLQGAPMVFLSFSNAAFRDFLLNWEYSVARLGVPYLVAAFDDETAEACKARGIPYHNLNVSSNEFFRLNKTEFRQMGSRKVNFVLEVLEEYKVQTVVVSDTDTVWLRDPSDYLQRHPVADWFISTDCLSHQVEVEWRENHWQPRCGHIPGNIWGNAFNTGVFAVRNRPAALAVLRQWRAFLNDPQRTKHLTEHGSVFFVTDQLALNLLLQEGMRPGPVKAVAEDPRTVWTANNTLRLHALPMVLFAGGHTTFVQRLPEALGVGEYVVHTTFQRFFEHQREGKRGRFREMGLWYLDEPGYYEGRFLQYQNPVLQFVAELERSRHSGGMAPLYKHMVAAAFQLAIFRDALALARLTNRTLILPTSWCWCDYDHVPHVLETCRMRGTNMQLPFKCPADFIFTTYALDAEPGLHYRMPGFLELPEVPEGIWRSKSPIELLPRRPAQLPGPHEGVGHSAQIWPGIQAGEARQVLAPIEEAAVLEIRGMQPGVFGGFQTQEENAEFDKMFARITVEAQWCCAGWVPAKFRDHVVFSYTLPPPLAGGWRAWEAPAMQPPSWCNDVVPENREFVQWPNHPCQFLTNATAAALAARIS